jgi:ribosomal protein S18 acetylase RimI-like enzyme
MPQLHDSSLPAGQTARTLVRRLRTADLPPLGAINGSFVADTELTLTRVVQGLCETSWILRERRLEEPFDRGQRYDIGDAELELIRSRLTAGKSLQLVADCSGEICGLLKVEPEQWRPVGRIWTILLDRRYRRQGLGRHLIEQATSWGRQHNLRALAAETQTNNVPACRFYHGMGFAPGGVDDRFYRYCQDPKASLEVAVFWYLDL